MAPLCSRRHTLFLLPGSLTSTLSKPGGTAVCSDLSDQAALLCVLPGPHLTTLFKTQTDHFSSRLRTHPPTTASVLAVGLWVSLETPPHSLQPGLKRALASPQTADVLTCPTSPAAAGLWLQPLKARRSGSIKEHMSEGTTNVPLTGWGEWQARPPKNPLPKSCLISCNQPCYPSVWRLDPTVLGQRLWAPASRPTPVTASPVTASRCPAARLCGTVPSRLPVWLPDPTRPCFPSAP